MQLVSAICEEFSDNILVDETNGSIVVNVPEKWFRTLDRRLTSMGLELVHKTQIKTSITVNYILKS